MDNIPDTKKCKCPCHKAQGLLVAAIGLDFLLGAFGVLSDRIVHIVWPILLILIGLKSSIGRGKCNCCTDA